MGCHLPSVIDYFTLMSKVGGGHINVTGLCTNTHIYKHLSVCELHLSDIYFSLWLMMFWGTADKTLHY